jgi:hypothetical protein
MTTRNRPPEPPAPDPAELAATADLARQAHQVAGELTHLVEQLHRLGWRTDEYSRDDLAAVASSLAGMAMRAAMHSGDTAALNEVSGASWKPLTIDDVLAGGTGRPDTGATTS